MLTPAELRLIQQDIAQTFQGTATILRGTVASSSTGSWNPGASYGTIATVPCALYYSSGSEGQRGGAYQLSEGWHVFVPVGTDVKAQDRLVVTLTTTAGTTTVSDTRTFDAQNVEHPSNWETARSVHGTEVGRT